MTVRHGLCSILGRPIFKAIATKMEGHPLKTAQFPHPVTIVFAVLGLVAAYGLSGLPRGAQAQQQIIGHDVQSTGGGVGQSIVNSGPGTGGTVLVQVPAGTSAIGTRVIQNGPGVGSSVVQNGPGVGFSSTVIVGPK